VGYAKRRFPRRRGRLFEIACASAPAVQPQGTVNTGLLSVVLSVNHGLVQLYRPGGAPYL